MWLKKKHKKMAKAANRDETTCGPCASVGNLDSYGLEKRRVSEGKLHHLFDLSELLPTAADVVVADVVDALLLVLSEGNRHRLPVRTPSARPAAFNSNAIYLPLE